MQQHALDASALVGATEQQEDAAAPASADAVVDLDESPVAKRSSGKPGLSRLTTSSPAAPASRRRRVGPGSPALRRRSTAPRRARRHAGAARRRPRTKPRRCRLRRTRTCRRSAHHGAAAVSRGSCRRAVRRRPWRADRERRFGLEQDLQVAGDADEGVGAERRAYSACIAVFCGPAGSTVQPARSSAA